jgi:hypothetical protein
MAVVTHLDRIGVTVNLDAVGAQQAGFYVLYLVPLAANSLNSATYMTFASFAEVDAASTAGYISATTLQALTDVFAQARVPSQIHVASVDLASSSGSIPDTYALVIASMISEGLDFYAVCIQDRDNTDVATVSDYIEALASERPYIFVGQSSDSDWKTATPDAAFNTVVGNERTVLVYHDTSTEHNDLVWASCVLAFTPDSYSAPWNRPLTDIVALATLTSAEKGYLRTNNANFGARLNSTYTFYMDPGRTMAGRAASERVSADWYAIRVQEGLAQLLGDLTNRGQKLTVSVRGVRQVEAIAREVYERGVTAGHFEPNQLTFTSATINADGTISSADLTAQRIRVTANIQLTTGAITIAFTANLSRTAVN